MTFRVGRRRGRAVAMGRGASKRRRDPFVVTVVTVVAGAVLAACSSTTSSSGSASSGSTRAPIPASAFHSTTGLTSSTIRIGNVSTETGGIFTGAIVGSEAYAAYVNSLGGVHGRKLIVDALDDGFTGQGNKQQTLAAVDNDFALVGSFSLEDSFGEPVIAQHPDVPVVATMLAPALNTLSNTFGANPTGGGWPNGPLNYYKRLYPTQIAHTAVLASEFPSAIASWKLEEPVLRQAGYKITYYAGVPLSQTDFTENVVQMKAAGVRLVYVDQLPENYAGALLRDMAEQDFHPVLVIGTAAYSPELVPVAGGPAAVEGANLEMPNALFLGEDAKEIPAVGLFLHWVQQVDPGFHPDYYTLAGWSNTQLFTEALQAAGSDPTQGSVQAALRKITSFDAGKLLATSNPADRKEATCYLVAKVVNGQFVRTDDPPVNGPTNGYRCDGGFTVS